MELLFQDHKDLADKLALWCLSIDTKDLERLSDIFAPDVEWDYGGGTVDTDLENVITRIRTHLIEQTFCGATQHNVSNLRIDIEGDEAETHAYFCGAHAGIGEFEGKTLVQWGIYQDFWRRTEAGWRIKKRDYTITISDGPLEIVYANVPQTMWKEDDKRNLTTS